MRTILAQPNPNRPKAVPACPYAKSVAVECGAVVAPSRDAVDEQIAAAVGADMPRRHRGKGLLLPLDDHDRPQSSSANRVTAGALRFLAFTQSRKRPD